MTTYVVFLRAINVGGRNLIAMSDLRDLCTSLGLAGAQTLLQSGNLIFQSNQRSEPALELLLEMETADRLGVTADFIVRSATDLNKAIARNPFPQEAKKDPSHLLIMFLKSAPPKKNVTALQAAIKGREIVRAYEKQLYAVYPDGIGRSKITTSLIERTLATRGTARNWNTVNKLAALCR
jgi:uncharacterized protein (DUF1697 family)